MNNVIEVQFKNKCCMCEKNSTFKIELQNVDLDKSSGFKYFCDDHDTDFIRSA